MIMEKINYRKYKIQSALMGTMIGSIFFDGKEKFLSQPSTHGVLTDIQ